MISSGTNFLDVRDQKGAGWGGAGAGARAGAGAGAGAEAGAAGGRGRRSPSIISRPYFQTDSIASAIIFDGNELSTILF